jgi:predicted DNA-binding transcriptional regulator AlpA
MYLSTVDAAVYLGCSTAWLVALRRRGDGPPIVRLGRNVKYPRPELESWARSRSGFGDAE